MKFRFVSKHFGAEFCDQQEPHGAVAWDIALRREDKSAQKKKIEKDRNTSRLQRWNWR